MSTGGTHAPAVMSPSSPVRPKSLNTRLIRSWSCANSRNGSLQRTRVMMSSSLPGASCPSCLSLPLRFRVLRVNDFSLFDVRTPRTPGTLGTLRTLRTLSTPIERLSNRMRRGLERRGRRLDRRQIVGLSGLPRIGNGRLDLRQLADRQLLAVVVDGFLDLIRERVGLVARVDELAPLTVLGGMALGVLHHPLDFLLREAARAADGDLLLLPGGAVLRRH